MYSNKPRILILGSSGSKMCQLVRDMIYFKEPYEIHSVDYINDIKTKYINTNHDFHLLDIRDQVILDKLFDMVEPSIVIHGANIKSGERSELIKTNVESTQNIINCCIKYKINKIIYLSTDQVYGELTQEQEPGWIETVPPSPLSIWAETIVKAESLFQNTVGLNYNILRLANNYGIRQSKNKLIPKIIYSIINNQPIELYDQGKAVRDWLSIWDCCRAIIFTIQRGKSGEIYNISAAQELSALEMAQKICNLMGRGHQLMRFIEGTNYNVFRRAMNSNKFKELGWSPQFKIAGGLENTVDWYNKNQWWFN